jgi:hypothetical protein
VISCASPDAANTLRDAYRTFLIANGGKETATTGELGNAIELMGSFELVFCHGKYVAGVHSAPKLPVAMELGAALQQRLTEKTK